MVALAVFLSGAWKRARAAAAASAGSDRALAWTFVGGLLVQLFLGATLRHMDSALFVHAGLGTVLLPLAALAGTRALGPAPEERPMRLAGISVLVLAFVQVLLGLAALVATRMLDAGPVPGIWNDTLATAHQGFGAALLAAAVTLALWTQRLRAPVARTVGAASLS
jgi:hypothetical protein